MARTYQTVNWQDGTVVTPAKVNVAGTEYEVTPAVKTGQTPLNATNLRKMDNEIKRIVEEDLPATEDVKLIDVTDTAPVEFEEGDKYYNTEDNKVYTAVEVGSTVDWDDGETPIEGVLYIVFTTQSSYAYDGTTLVSVGGGSGSSDIVMVNEEPTEDTKLYIENEDLEPQGLPIADSYNNANNMAYSCNYIEKLNTYSTTEQRIGTWTNGKPVYRKIFTGTKGSSIATVIGSISNIYVIRFSGFVTSTSGAQLQLGSYIDNSNNYSAILYRPSTSEFTLYAPGIYSGNYVVIVEYIKTTD